MTGHQLAIAGTPFRGGRRLDATCTCARWSVSTVVSALGLERIYAPDPEARLRTLLTRQHTRHQREATR